MTDDEIHQIGNDLVNHILDAVSQRTTYYLKGMGVDIHPDLILPIIRDGGEDNQLQRLSVVCTLMKLVKIHIDDPREIEQRTPSTEKVIDDLARSCAGDIYSRHKKSNERTNMEEPGA